MKKLIYLIGLAIIVASCTKPMHNGNMKGEANKDRVQKFYEQVMNAHNPAMVDSFCVEDFIDHTPDQGFSGKGIADLKSQLSNFFTGFPDVKFTPNFLTAEGDTVTIHMTIEGTNSGPMMGMPATNKQVSIEGIDIIILKDGKATDRWGYFDMMKFMTQLGLMPEPGAGRDSTDKK
jgi:steroid delta-isomerase-like uncharacterized protein